MSSTPTRSIALTQVLDAYVQAQVVSGRYSSASEVVRNGLRLLMEQDEARQARIGGWLSKEGSA